MTIKHYRRGFTVDDCNGLYPPQLDRKNEDSIIRIEIDGEANLVMDSEVNGQTTIFYVPMEAVVELFNIHAEYAVKHSRKKKK